VSLLLGSILSPTFCASVDDNSAVVFFAKINIVGCSSKLSWRCDMAREWLLVFSDLDVSEKRLWYSLISSIRVLSY
jgi:hypothetical protein